MLLQLLLVALSCAGTQELFQVFLKARASLAT